MNSGLGDMIIATDEIRPDYQNTFFYYFDETHNSKIGEPYVYHGQITPDYSTGWSHVGNKQMQP